MKTILKGFGAVLVIVVGVLSVSYLQHRFDQSDIKHALQAVRMTQPKGADSLPLEQALAEHYGVPIEKIQWSPLLESKVKGIVQIEAKIPGVTEPLLWQVDLVRFQILPQSAAAKELFH